MSADWKSIASKVAAVAPNLGALLGGPVGAGVGIAGKLISTALGCDNTPDAVEQALAINPDAAIKLREIEKDEKLGLAQLANSLQIAQVNADAQSIQSVNATMQAETKSDHWPSYCWRPFCGFVFGIMFIGVYFVLPLCRVPVPVVPFEAWVSMGSVLGVASYFRGKMQADPSIPTDNRG